MIIKSKISSLHLLTIFLENFRNAQAGFNYLDSESDIIDAPWLSFSQDDPQPSKADMTLPRLPTKILQFLVFRRIMV
ncbi:MAG: hypothetical protein R3B93_23505 [Bacteroidia bacterium]